MDGDGEKMSQDSVLDCALVLIAVRARPAPVVPGKGDIPLGFLYMISRLKLHSLFASTASHIIA